MIYIYHWFKIIIVLEEPKDGDENILICVIILHVINEQEIYNRTNVDYGYV